MDDKVEQANKKLEELKKIITGLETQEAVLVSDLSRLEEEKDRLLKECEEAGIKVEGLTVEKLEEFITTMVESLNKIINEIEVELGQANASV